MEELRLRAGINVKEAKKEGNFLKFFIFPTLALHLLES